jgi:hypothetical protein
MGQANRRDALQADELGCLDPAMSGDDLVIIAYQHRIPEFLSTPNATDIGFSFPSCIHTSTA